MSRAELVDRLTARDRYDLVVVGGGATGCGVALDAAARGLAVALVESNDFGAGTSSRATKLVHGGVRYLAQGRVGMVREALHERTRLLRNAPHLASPLAFVMPAYRRWERPFYGAGLALYDLLAGREGLGRTRLLDMSAALASLPGLKRAGLRGGVRYWDGQFDDARLALALARTAQRHGAAVLNHCEATGLVRQAGRIDGVECRDTESGGAFTLRARCVVNATGVWVDDLRIRGAAGAPTPAPLVVPSQGVHVVVDRDFMPGHEALIVPRTEDGRVLFAVPWLGKLVLGTTDTARTDLPREPQPLPGELDFILSEAARYLERAPTLADVRSVWVGLRPLVRPASLADGGRTGAISREHTVEIGPAGLVTVTGGKWTTYRAMAEDVLARCAAAGLLPPTAGGRTAQLRLVGGDGTPAGPGALAQAPGLHLYGSEAPRVQALPGVGHWLAPGLSEAMVRYAIRHEYARNVEDVLARRSRLLFLDADAARRAAPAVAHIAQEETGADPCLQPFVALATRYALDGAAAAMAAA